MVLKTPTKDSCKIGEELSGKFDQPATNCLWIRHRYNCISWGGDRLPFTTGFVGEYNPFAHDTIYQMTTNMIITKRFQEAIVGNCFFANQNYKVCDCWKNHLWFRKCEGMGSFFVAKSCLTHQWPSLFACDFVTPPIVCLCVQYTWDLLTFSSISSKACISNLLNGMRDSDEESCSCVLSCRL